MRGIICTSGRRHDYSIILSSPRYKDVVVIINDYTTATIPPTSTQEGGFEQARQVIVKLGDKYIRSALLESAAIA